MYVEHNLNSFRELLRKLSSSDRALSHAVERHFSQISPIPKTGERVKSNLRKKIRVITKKFALGVRPKFIFSVGAVCCVQTSLVSCDTCPLDLSRTLTHVLALMHWPAHLLTD